MSVASVGIKSRPAVSAPTSGGSWRMVQGVLALIVLALTFYYNVWGWASDTVAVRPAPWSLENTGFLVLLALVLLLSPTAWVVARATFQETIRKRALNVILFIGLVMIVSALIFSWMNPGEEEKFIRDVGLGAMLFIAIIISVVMASGSIPQEIERKTIFTILSKPVERFHYVLGKYLGILLTLVVNLGIMGLLFCVEYYLKRRTVPGAFLGFETLKNVQAIMMIFFQVSVVAALAVMVSVVSTSNIFTISCGFFVFVAGQMSSSWQHIREHSQSPVVENIIKIVYYVLPRLDHYDVRDKLIIDEPILFNYMWYAISGGLVYTAAVLAIAYLFFNDREF